MKKYNLSYNNLDFLLDKIFNFVIMFLGEV